MEGFKTFSGIAIPIDILNCDTDQIIPARFLRRPKTDANFHTFLWHDLRFDNDGSVKRDFIFNKAPFDQATVVVADINWGCGSSRENAVYALVSNGIRAVIAPSFGDIHFNNCMKLGVLPVRLSREICDKIRLQLHENPGAQISFDLDAQSVTAPDSLAYYFEIDPFDKYRMLNGLDDYGITREYDNRFVSFEAKHKAKFDWLYSEV